MTPGAPTAPSRPAGYPAELTERVLIQAPRGTTLGRQEADAVAGELRTRLSALPQVGRVGSLIRAEDGRSALLPVVLDDRRCHRRRR